jgi:hypothetical protein
MTTITIFVSKLSKKILLAEYGEEPLQLDKNGMIYDQMRIMRRHTTALKPRSLEWISEPVEIQVYDALAKFIAKNNTSVGLVLLAYHRDCLLRYVEALAENGMKIDDAIERFYRKYKLTDEDYSMEAADRRFTFFKSKRGKIYKKFGTKRAPAPSQKIEVIIPPCDKKTIELARTLVAEIKATNRVVGKCFERHLSFYLLYKLNRYSVRKIAAKMDGKRNTVWNGIQSVSAILVIDTHISKIVTPHLPAS